MFNVPERYRARWPRNHPNAYLSTTSHDGNNGVFIIPANKARLFCIASDGAGWEHVSVTVRAINKSSVSFENVALRMPKWAEMCYVKELFWGEEDTVLQYHPPKSAYVNCHPTCLHLWRPIGVEVPVPHPLLVGPQDDDTG